MYGSQMFAELTNTELWFLNNELQSARVSAAREIGLGIGRHVYASGPPVFETPAVELASELSEIESDVNVTLLSRLHAVGHVPPF